MLTPRERLLILVVAYNAVSTLAGVLDRLPLRILDEYDCEVLVIDDASADDTFTLGNAYGRARRHLPLTVLRNPDNQGYGGNQKIGYTYAVRQGFDLVALLHGDGQYAPEELPRLLEPVRAGEADAVFGSRMLSRGGALAGGMPLYKFVGNRILTTAQNALTGARLSEWHSGYRVYSVAALRRIHFELDDDGFAFDTEIILQLQHAGARILELPIPTFYGDEISRVDGVRYAGQVVRATAGSALHRRGLVQHRRLDPVDHEPAYDLKLGYPSSHTYALDAVPAGSSVLDLGGGPGALAAELVAKGCDVVLVDQRPPKLAPATVTVHLQDLDDPPTYGVADRDVLLMLDVVQNLRDPELFLDRLRELYGDKPRLLILTVPNVAFVVERLMLAAGRFNYSQEGILDRTHSRRLFTFPSLRRLLRDAGFRDVRMRGVPAPFPKALGDTRTARALLRLNLALIRLSPRLFAYQIFVQATPTPTTAHRLGLALRSRRP